MCGQYFKNCLQMVLNGKKNVSKSNEEFVKNYDEDSNKKYILKVDLEYSLRNSTICIAIYYSYQKE